MLGFGDSRAIIDTGENERVGGERGESDRIVPRIWNHDGADVLPLEQTTLVEEAREAARSIEQLAIGQIRQVWPVIMNLSESLAAARIEAAQNLRSRAARGLRPRASPTIARAARETAYRRFRPSARRDAAAATLS